MEVMLILRTISVRRRIDGRELLAVRLDSQPTLSPKARRCHIAHCHGCVHGGENCDGQLPTEGLMLTILNGGAFTPERPDTRRPRKGAMGIWLKPALSVKKCAQDVVGPCRLAADERHTLNHTSPVEAQPRVRRSASERPCP